MKAVILAGGFGTRMGEVCKDTPKPMIKLNNKPILLWQIEFFKREGIKDIIIVTGYLHEKIEEFFGDGSLFGVNITYFIEKEPLGTAGALFKLKLTEDFILCNGDLIFDFDLASMTAFHNDKNALATLLVHPNSHPYDSMTLNCDDDGKVTEIYAKSNKPEFYPNICNAGIEIISPSLIKRFSFNGNMNLDKDIIANSLNTSRIYAYRTAEYVHDTGTPERMKRTSADIIRGIVAGSNKKIMQKAIFLDRDGTVNKLKGYITDTYELELTEGIAEAIKGFNKSGFITVIVTNQPVIARGDCSLEELKNIHNRLEMLLSEKGAYIDKIYFCPHHPDKGFEGEVSELKINCGCRKPAPGMLLKAQKDLNIDLSRSYMVGDTQVDADAGKNAGCTSVVIGNESCNADLLFNDITEFSDYLKNI